jgi:hypothetical protein
MLEQRLPSTGVVEERSSDEFHLYLSVKPSLFRMEKGLASMILYLTFVLEVVPH